MKKKWLVLLLTICALFTCLFGLASCDGADGKSAYEIWLENGHTGTEEDFLDWLRDESAVEEGTQGLHYQRISGRDEYRVADMGYAEEWSVVIPATHNGLPVTEIGSQAFKDAYIENITIGSNVARIGKEAFYGCHSLESVTIPDSVTSIGEKAFYDCTNLASVTIPDSVTSIGKAAFYDCSNLTRITIPASVTNIGSSAFLGCYKLVEVVNKSSEITVTKGSEENGRVGYYALSVYNSGDTYVSKLSSDNGYIVHTDGDEKILVGYTGAVSNLVLPSSIDKINRRAFYDCSSLTSIVIPDSVTSIGDGAFYNCINLTSVDIGDSVTSIGSSAFAYCESLTSVTFGENSRLTSFGSSAFRKCTSLTSVTIGDSVTSIGGFAFEGCDSLTSIVIPDSVTSIGGFAFDICDSLTIYCEATEKPDGWDSYWNSDNRPVEWGYKGN